MCERESVSTRRRTRRDLLIKEAGGKCTGCGYDKCSDALHFHHRDPSQKKFPLIFGQMTRHSLQELQTEAAKCALLCGNCHYEEEERLWLASGLNPSVDSLAIPDQQMGRCLIHGWTKFYDCRPEGLIRRRCQACHSKAFTESRQSIKDLLIDELGGECFNCAYSSCRRALQFHHRDPALKSFSVGKAIGNQSLTVLLGEVRKCDLLCSNCHAERHYLSRVIARGRIGSDLMSHGGRGVTG